METWSSHAIIASLMTVILCQINSLLQKKDHFNKPTIIFQRIDYCLHAIYIKLSPKQTFFREYKSFLRYFTDLANFLLITDFLA